MTWLYQIKDRTNFVKEHDSIRYIFLRFVLVSIEWNQYLLHVFETYMIFLHIYMYKNLADIFQLITFQSRSILTFTPWYELSAAARMYLFKADLLCINRYVMQNRTKFPKKESTFEKRPKCVPCGGNQINQQTYFGHDEHDRWDNFKRSNFTAKIKTCICCLETACFSIYEILYTYWIYDIEDIAERFGTFPTLHRP